jgi:hypothetical protein
MENEQENDFDESEADDVFYTGEEVHESDLERTIRQLAYTKRELDHLIRVADNIHNIEFYEIYDKIIKYIHLYCKHEYETDLIDITPDRSQTIQYCIICKEMKP